MGFGRMDDSDWKDYSSVARTKTKTETFTRSSAKSTSDPRTSMDPKTIMTRESRDSTVNPNSTPVILAFDVTGSMGDIPFYFIREGLGTLMKEIYDRKPVSDPHILCMAVGDAYCDSAPLQVSQFEGDIKIAKQLEDFYVEGGGGGNEGESYHLPWYFAAMHTSTDSFEKRGKKGILFTIGDEPPLKTLTGAQIKKIFAEQDAKNMTSEQILELVKRQYDVYHVIVEQGNGFRGFGPERVVREWNNLLGQSHVLRLSDYTKLSEVVIAAIQMNAGMDRDAVVKSWKGGTSLVVDKALPKTTAVARKPGGGKTGLVRLDAPQVA